MGVCRVVAAGTLACNAGWAGLWSWASVHGLAWARKVSAGAAFAAALALVALRGISRAVYARRCSRGAVLRQTLCNSRQLLSAFRYT